MSKTPTPQEIEEALKWVDQYGQLQYPVGEDRACLNEAAKRLAPAYRAAMAENANLKGKSSGPCVHDVDTFSSRGCYNCVLLQVEKAEAALAKAEGKLASYPWTVGDIERADLKGKLAASQIALAAKDAELAAVNEPKCHGPVHSNFKQECGFKSFARFRCLKCDSFMCRGCAEIHFREEDSAFRAGVQKNMDDMKLAHQKLFQANNALSIRAEAAEESLARAEKVIATVGEEIMADCEGGSCDHEGVREYLAARAKETRP